MKGFRTWRVEIGTGYDSRPNTIHFARRKDARAYAMTIKQRCPSAEVNVIALEPMFKDFQKLVAVGSDEYKNARISGYRKMQE